MCFKHLYFNNKKSKSLKNIYLKYIQKQLNIIRKFNCMLTFYGICKDREAWL